jgi:hypothetical protein
MAQLRLGVTVALAFVPFVTAAPARADDDRDPPGAPWTARPEAAPRASSAPPSAAPPAQPAPSSSSPASTPRVAPDYDGRPDVPEEDGAAIWTARILLAPLWLVTEYGIRAPARGAFWVAEEASPLRSVADEVTQHPDDTLGLTPIGVVDLGEHPMIGVYAQMDHLMAPWERLRGVALVGGVDVMRVHVVDEMRLRDDAHLLLDVAGLRRDDLLTWGTGPRSDEAAEGTYAVAMVEGGARLHVTLAPRDLVSTDAWINLRRARIDDGDCGGDTIVSATGAPFRCGDPSVLALARAGRGEPPSGFGNTTTIATGARFAIDAPPPRGVSSVGGHLALSAEQHARVDGPREGAWVRWTGRGALAADITGTGRVIAIGAQIEGVERLSEDTTIPLLDLPGAQRLDDDLEGDLLLGVRPGRTVGESLAQVAIDYRWPIWTVVDAQLQAGLGNAFGRHLDGFDPELLRFAFAGGFIAPIRADYTVRLLAGFSTDTLDDGAEPALARVLVAAGTDL